MSIRGQSPYRIFLVLTPFRTYLPRLHEILAPLAELEPHLPGVEGYYHEATDAALLCLQFRQRAVERVGADILIDLVAECGLPVIAADELADHEREAFYGGHLHTYETRIQQYPDAGEDTPLIRRVVDALSEHVPRSFHELTVPDASVPRGVLGGSDASRPISEITGSDYDIIEITDVDPAPRASSRWEISAVRDRPDDSRPHKARPSSQWELVL